MNAAGVLDDPGAGEIYYKEKDGKKQQCVLPELCQNYVTAAVENAAPKDENSGGKSSIDAGMGEGKHSVQTQIVNNKQPQRENAEPFLSVGIFLQPPGKSLQYREEEHNQNIGIAVPEVPEGRVNPVKGQRIFDCGDISGRRQLQAVGKAFTGEPTHKMQKNEVIQQHGPDYGFGGMTYGAPVILAVEQKTAGNHPEYGNTVCQQAADIAPAKEICAALVRTQAGMYTNDDQAANETGKLNPNVAFLFHGGSSERFFAAVQRKLFSIIGRNLLKCKREPVRLPGREDALRQQFADGMEIAGVIPRKNPFIDVKEWYMIHTRKHCIRSFGECRRFILCV